MNDKPNTNQGGAKPVRRKTPEMARMVEQGYGMSIEDAKRIIKDWETNPQSWPYEQVQKARGAIAAYETDPVPISTDPGWKREKRKYR